MKINIILRFSDRYNKTLKYQTDSFNIRLGDESTFVSFVNNYYIILSGYKVNKRLKSKYGDLVCSPLNDLTFSYRLT